MLTAIASFITHGAPHGDTSLFSLVLESDRIKSFIKLNFESNSGLTLRHIIGEALFPLLVEKIVEMNDRDPYMNVLLLDKINRREQVLKELIRI
jgi:hypothetical protein